MDSPEASLLHPGLLHNVRGSVCLSIVREHPSKSLREFKLFGSCPRITTMAQAIPVKLYILVDPDRPKSCATSCPFLEGSAHRCHLEGLYGTHKSPEHLVFCHTTERFDRTTTCIRLMGRG